MAVAAPLIILISFLSKAFICVLHSNYSIHQIKQAYQIENPLLETCGQRLRAVTESNERKRSYGNTPDPEKAHLGVNRDSAFF